MSWRSITGLVVVTTIIALLAYDAFVIVTAGKNASISQVVIDYSYEYPIGVLLVGITLGHLFWRMPERKK